MSIARIYRSVSQFHENPTLQAFSATPLGILVVWLCAAALLWESIITFAAALVMAAIFIKPERRELIMACAAPWALYSLISYHLQSGIAITSAAVILVLVLFGIYSFACHLKSLPAFTRRHPLITLHVILLLIVVAMDYIGDVFPQTPKTLIIVAAMLNHFIWCTGYFVLAARKRPDKAGKFRDHLYYFITLFPFVHVPYGKGHDYLSSRRVSDPIQLAHTRLSGLKLLALAGLWTVARESLHLFVFYGGSHSFGSKIDNFTPIAYTVGSMVTGAAPDNLPIHIAWLGVFLDLVIATLNLAIIGHSIVGVLRLFGYNIFRNTYKPLLSQSIVDFWNRYYYYFKELLVEFFFYPTFLSYFKNSPRLRMFVAIMAAAFFGNTYYHLLMWLSWGDASFITGQGMTDRLIPYLFYSFLLGLGVYISMLREQARRGQPLPPGGVSRWIIARRIAGVWLFFGLLRIWDVGAAATLEQRADFFLSLFGI